MGSTVWFRFYSTANNLQISIRTYGSDFDTVLAVYQQLPTLDVSNPTPIQLQACNDDSRQTAQSQIDFASTIGWTYWIQVGGKDGATGSLALRIGGAESSSLPGFNDDALWAHQISAVPYSFREDTLSSSK